MKWLTICQWQIVCTTNVRVCFNRSHLSLNGKMTYTVLYYAEAPVFCTAELQRSSCVLLKSVLNGFYRCGIIIYLHRYACMTTRESRNCRASAMYNREITKSGRCATCACPFFFYSLLMRPRFRLYL